MLGEGLEGPAYHACAPNPCCMGTCSGWPEGYSMTSFSCRGLAPSSGWTASVFGRRAWSVLRGLETLYKVSSLANMLVFLRNGVYRCALIYSVCRGLFLPPVSAIGEAYFIWRDGPGSGAVSHVVPALFAAISLFVSPSNVLP